MGWILHYLLGFDNISALLEKWKKHKLWSNLYLVIISAKKSIAIDGRADQQLCTVVFCSCPIKIFNVKKKNLGNCSILPLSWFICTFIFAVHLIILSVSFISSPAHEKEKMRYGSLHRGTCAGPHCTAETDRVIRPDRAPTFMSDENGTK